MLFRSLFVAAERATPDSINFMATHARGLISLALTEQRMRELGLSLIADDQGNSTRFGTAFATPIDAREGVVQDVAVGLLVQWHARNRNTSIARAHARADDRSRALSTA